MSDSNNSVSKQMSMVNLDLINLFIEFEEYAIFLLNAEGDILSWNKGAVAIFGFSTTEIINKNIEVLFNGSEKGEIVKEVLLRSLQSGKHELERYLLRKDHQPFIAHMSFRALYEGKGKFKGFATIVRDITEQHNLQQENKLLNEKLEEKVALRTRELAIVNQELEAFSYSVSHDLRTPLRAISGYTEILREDYEHLLDSDGKRVLQNIIDGSRMMGRLIDDLLSFSKMSRLEIKQDSVDMEQLVALTIKELLQGMQGDRYLFEVGALPPCIGDPSMLKQVWANLIDNAIKYSSTKAHPHIKIGSFEEGKEQVYYVKDNGAGFDMKYANKLFGVFQRLHRQDEFEGTGLGLALAKRIITKHGGDIWADASLKEGASFFFRLAK